MVWRNYHYGDPALRQVNLFLFAWFVAKVLAFLFIFGDIVGDTAAFAGLIGMSLALNHGTKDRRAIAQEKPVPLRGPAADSPRFPARPALPA